MTETVEILEEEDGDARQVETVETLEDGNRDEEQDIKVMEERDGASAGTRKKVGRVDSSKHLVQYNTKWESEFPWLIPKKDNSNAV